MSQDNLKTRSQIDDKYKWNIEAMIPDESIIDQQLKQLRDEAEDYAARFSNRLTQDAATLADAFEAKDHIWRRLEKIYVYCHMRRDEDNSSEKYQGYSDKCSAVIAAVSASMSFFTPQLLSASEDVIMSFIQEEPRLETYDFAIRDTLRLKAHVLTPAEENIMAQMSEITSATNDIFTMLNNADLKFKSVTDKDGNELALTHGSYIKIMESRDPDLRLQAYNSMYESYKELINTVATAYSYNTRTDAVTARLRNYPSARAASLAADNVPEEVYDNLIDVVNESLPLLHRYMQLKKKLLGTDKMGMQDVYVPIIDIPERSVPFEEAVEIITQALKPLGDEYISRMKEGISQGWIDIYENQGKTSGAYSFGCYDSYPYILLNYADTLKDVFTLIHEMGHSMHSSYTRENQPYIYGSHSIFTAEVASTVNESLLMGHLFNTTDNLQMRKYLLNLHLEEFRTTLFRQTMFAEFEKMTHEAVESGQVLTAQWMCRQYEQLNRKYYGPAVEDDDTIKYEWARIPHFYNAFYVYKYATGYSAATAISERILTEGKPAADKYIEFLKTGESDYPIQLLKIAGVDMSSPEPVRKAMEKFASLLEELERLA